MANKSRSEHLRDVDSKAIRKLRRREERLLQGKAALFSVGRAAELLPGSDDDMREMLIQSGRGMWRRGRLYIVWEEALLAFEETCDEKSRTFIEQYGEDSPSLLDLRKG